MAIAPSRLLLAFASSIVASCALAPLADQGAAVAGTAGPLSFRHASRLCGHRWRDPAVAEREQDANPDGEVVQLLRQICRQRPSCC